ncbi:hypothetical protein GQ600_2219 [Phytophthora cactorum]|nr:hypothetical protein GQ600_2219 [Phytophthora cactorum]
MKGIMKGLETVQEDKWKIVFVFCVGLTISWVVQPDEGHRKKLVVVMETGPGN